jgi:hypothetical protein
MQKPLTAVMQKEMTRKEFLATLGFGVASIMGFSNVIRLVTGKSLGKQLGIHHVGAGYGATSYGGGEE